MFSSVGLPELVLVFVIGLLILGPERLPRVASQLGRWIGKARRTANQLRFQMEREIALADIERTKPRKPDVSKDGTTGQDQAGTGQEDGSTDKADAAGTSDEAPAGDAQAAAETSGSSQADTAKRPPTGADVTSGAETTGAADTAEADADRS